MISPERILKKPHNVVVSDSIAGRKIRWRFIFPYIEDCRPEVSLMVCNEYLKNRINVKCGQVVSWGKYGEVAIVKDDSGLKAAFWHHELMEPLHGSR